MQLYDNPSYEKLTTIIKVLEANYTGLLYTDGQGTEYVISGACTTSFNDNKFVSFIFSNLKYPRIIHIKPVQEFLDVYNIMEGDGL